MTKSMEFRRKLFPDFHQVFRKISSDILIKKQSVAVHRFSYGVEQSWPAKKATEDAK